MVIDYTAEQNTALQEISNHYKGLLHEKDVEMKKHGSKTKAYARLLEERDIIEGEYVTAIEDKQRAIELAYFTAFNGDIPAITEEAHRQTGLIIENYIACDLVIDDPTAPEPQLIPRYEANGHKPVLSSRIARHFIYQGIKLLTDYLQEHAPKEAKALNQYISEYISACPYVYVDTEAEEGEEDASTEPSEGAGNTLSISSKGVTSFEYPLDKINKTIWRNLEGADPFGQIEFYFDTVKKAKAPEALVMLSIDFSLLDNTGIVKRLTAFDKRVYITVNGLYAAGYDLISVNQIYSAMTHRNTTPNKADRKKINDSLTKLRAPIHLDNTQEILNGIKYPRFKYDGALLPFDRIEANVQGNEAEVIRIYRPASEKDNPNRALPLVNFAKQRGQYTTISSQLFGTLSLTESNLEIEDYLIEQIGHIKRGKINNKMLYSSIYEATHQTSWKQQSRAKEKIKAILEHFKETGFILSYQESENKDGITIVYDKKKAVPKKK